MTSERFDQYLERCLYHPTDGFYAGGGGVAGRRGDFITSPEIGPLFGDVLARALDAWWVDLGRPDHFTVYDIGTGPGALVRALSRAEGPSAAARTVIGLDRAGGDQVDPLDMLPDDLGHAVVIANELLDNLPFRVVERCPDGWCEVHVVSGTGPPVERLEPIEDPGLDLPVGARAPLLEAAGRWVAEIRRRRPAVLLVFDYGAATTRQLAERGGWLRTYRHHERGSDPLNEPGRWDITTDIALDQLPTPTEVLDQAAFLRRWGIEEMVEEGRRHWRQHAAAPDVAALRMRSRVAEAEALLDPTGLGSWLACLWSEHRFS